MYILILFFLLFLCNSIILCNPPIQPSISKIAFGSCNRQNLKQPLWQPIVNSKPDIFIWLGDLVYADHTFFFSFLRYQARPKHVKKIYQQQLNKLEYQYLLNYFQQKYIDQPKLLNGVIGLWDDHDYGKNDGDKRYKYKDQNQQILEWFFRQHNNPLIKYDDDDDNDDHANHQRQHHEQEKELEKELEKEQQQEKELEKETQVTTDAYYQHYKQRHEGAYRHYIYGPIGQQVEIILLDVRYFQDRHEKDLLGIKQWNWLKDILINSQANLLLIGSGTQIIHTTKKIGEGWQNFPLSRKKLFNYIENYLHSKISVLFLSGDVHYAEIIQTYQCLNILKVKNFDEYDVLLQQNNQQSRHNETHKSSCRIFTDITSSSLTHSWGDNKHFGQKISKKILHKIMPTSLRIDDIFTDNNFGLIEINWLNSTIDILIKSYATAKDQDGEIMIKKLFILIN